MIMDFMRKNWYYVGGVLFVVLAIVLVYSRNDITVLQRILLMSFMALLVHQFEEYGWPGGEPAVMNIAMRPSGDKPDRYPLNRQSALIINVFIAYSFYILAIIFSNVIWLGLATMFFGMAQIVVHGIMWNKKMHSIYNPGLFAVVFLHWPIGIYYIWYVVVNDLVLWWMWPVAIIVLVAIAFFGVYLPEDRWLADKNSQYPFSEEEMSRFNVREKMERLNAKKA
jgi:hypothetical protein